MKTLRFIGMGLFAVLLSFSIVSCGDDEDDQGEVTPVNPDNLIGWYALGAAKTSDFDVINEAIWSNEVLTSYRHATFVATKELFLENGWYSDSDAKFGRLRFTINSVINAINIIDSNTLVFYCAYLWPEGHCKERDHELVYKLYAGPIFGDMAYYGKPTYYTYQKIENKIIVSNGNIYTITANGLIEDGGSELWKKYDHNKQNV